jgi:hypothetical protein
MKIAIVSLSDIAKHPTSRMDAAYWIGKKNGKKAFKNSGMKDGRLVEDDVNGKTILTQVEADQYNDTMNQINELNGSISHISKKVK